MHKLRPKILNAFAIFISSAGFLIATIHSHVFAQWLLCLMYTGASILYGLMPYNSDDRSDVICKILVRVGLVAIFVSASTILFFSPN